MKLFNEYESYVNNDGVKITKFKPSVEVMIWSIDLFNGNFEKKRITDFSKHENIVMYKIEDPKKRFETFWSSEDHSLIVYNKQEDEYEKISPKIILMDPNNYLLIQRTDDKPNVIECKEIKMEIDPEKTIGYDFTVEDNFTFCTFDGIAVQDTMAAFQPLTIESINEVKDNMMFAISKDGMNKIADSFNKDTVHGLYCLTKNIDQLKSANLNGLSEFKNLDKIEEYSIYEVIKYNGMLTTIGRLLFNLRCLPKDHPFINEEINKKKINNLALEVYNKYGYETYIDFIDIACKLSYKYGTIYSNSLTLDDLNVLPPSIIDIKDKLSKLKSDDYETAQKLLDLAEKELKKYSEENNTNFGEYSKSGVLKGGFGQTRQILVAKGLATDTSGKLLPIIGSSYADGLKSRQFFETGASTRKGIADRVLNTATTGYMSRQSVFALQSVEGDPKLIDCKTKRAVQLKVDKQMAERLIGRWVLNNNKVEQFNNSMIGKVIKLRSPVYCKSPKICSTCYGKLLERNKTPFIGVVAATILGERGSQLIMRQFHTGGAVSIKIPNVEEMVTSQFDNDLVKQYKNIFSQNSSNFYSKLPCRIIIDKLTYLETKDIELNQKNKTLKLAYGYFDIVINDNLKFDFTLDCTTTIDLNKCSSFHVTDKNIIIDYEKPGNIFDVPPSTDDFMDGVKIIKHILNGKKPWTTPDHFLLKIYDFYKNQSDCDMVHFEIVVSQLLRDSGNPCYPARLNPVYKPKIISLKSIPEMESSICSLGFENLNKSIAVGLTYNNENNDSIIQKIMTGNL